jgi:hypothetical protein
MFLKLLFYFILIDAANYKNGVNSMHSQHAISLWNSYGVLRRMLFLTVKKDKHRSQNSICSRLRQICPAFIENKLISHKNICKLCQICPGFSWHVERRRLCWLITKEGGATLNWRCHHNKKRFFHLLLSWSAASRVRKATSGIDDPPRQ